MKILSVITGYPPAIGGAQLHAHLLNLELSKKHEIAVVCQWDSVRYDWLRGTTISAPAPKQYSFDNILVNVIAPTLAERKSLLPYVGLYYFLQRISLSKISKVLVEHLAPFVDGVDIVHNIRMGREALSYASLQTARERGIPFVFSPLHHPRWSSWLYRSYISLYKEADLILTLTNIERDTLIYLGVKSERVKVVGHGPHLAENFETDKFIAGMNIQGPSVLFLGQKYDYKGFEALLNAAEYVWREFPEVHFLFIGPRTKKSEKVFKSISDPRIIELGMVDLETKTSALMASDILCVPSTQESFGGVYLEGWLSGCAVIGGTAPAISEVISHGEDGLIVSQNPKQIAESLLVLLKDSKLRDEMVAAGNRKVKDLYSWKIVAKKVEEAYQSILK